MNTRRTIKKTGMVLTTVFFLLTFVLVGNVLAVHDLSLFELDRDALDDGSITGDDWDTLYMMGGSAAEFTGIIGDVSGSNPFGTTGTQFQAGGSKDDLDISPGGATGQYWKWEPGEPLDKDDITNAYAAAYINTVASGVNEVGDLIIFFGLDRFANNGSAQVGFWFLQDSNFGLTDIKDGGGYQFSGHHEVGDILVQSNFSNGGEIDTISVYAWVGSGGSEGTLDLLFSAQDCETTPAGDPACATVNQDDTPAPWDFVPKFGEEGTFPPGSFFEGGINLSYLVPDAGCFTGFLAETRSSTPFDARLKDFAFGEFDLCGIEVTKDGDALSKIGDSVDYTITVENTGVLTLDKVSIDDTLLGDLTTEAGCGDSLMPGETCTIEVSRTVQSGDPDPLDNTVAVVYGRQGDTVTSSDDHSVNLFQPSITFSKDGSTTLSKEGDTIHYTLTLDNTSSADSPDMTCVISDPTLGINETVNLASGEQSVVQESKLMPASPDPYVNTASATCAVDGFGNTLQKFDNWNVNLFYPGIAVDKTGDELSKVGDDVEYTITLSNNSSADTPDLDCTASDTLLGVVYDGVLPLGDTVLNRTYTVQSGDPDPLVNTVTLMCSPLGFPNILTDADGHSTELFQPSIEFDKSVSSNLSKVGDEVTYTLTLENTSSPDTPDLDCTISDPMLSVSKNVTLASGEVDTTSVPYTFQSGDADPFVNTADVMCSPAGFPNVLNAADGETVELFQPSIEFDKSVNSNLSKVGDDVTYTLTLTNTSSPDTPDLDCTISDPLLSVSKDVMLASGEVDTTSVPYTFQSGDADPFVNTADVTCSPAGFPNVLNAADGETVELFQPSIEFDKSVSSNLSKVGDDVTYTLTLTNTSSPDTPDLNCTVSDPLLSVSKDVMLASGELDTTSVPYTFQMGDADPFVNTADVTCSPAGFPNVLEAADSETVELFQPSIEFDKSVSSNLSKVGDGVTYTLTLTNTSSPDAPDLDCTITDPLLSVSKNVTLASGEVDTTSVPYTFQMGDADPFVNTADVTCSPAGFPNVLDAADSETVELFQPAIAVDKTGDDLGKVSDPVDYTITLTNNSSADTPAMTCVASDSLLGVVFNDVLPLGDTVLNLSRVVQAGDPDPLVNTVDVSCTFADFPNVLTDSDSHTTELFQPAVEVIKDGPDTGVRGETVTYSFVINNLSSADSPDLLLESVTDTIIGDLTAAASAGGCGTLAFGGSCSFTADYTIAMDDPNPLVNVVTVLYHPEGFPNDVTDDDYHSLDIPILGCTPGFWQGGAGAPLWNEASDPDWTYGGVGTNPFHHDVLFNEFFNGGPIDDRLDDWTMYKLVSTGGGSDSAQRAARDMVAAYLNESAFPEDFPADSLAELESMWYDAVAGGDPALDAFHQIVSGWNDPMEPGYCPLP